MTVLVNGSDPRTVTTVGFYTVKTPASLTGVPGWFDFIMMLDNNNAKYRSIIGTSDATAIYYAHEFNGVWSDWYVLQNTGLLSDLKTTAKSSGVSAINELYSCLENLTKDIIKVGSDSEIGGGKWFKVCSQTCSGYGNTNIMFAVTRGYASTDDYGQGILSIQIRSDPTLIGIKQFTWLANSGFNPNHFIIVISGMTWALYTHNTRQYNHIKFEVLSCGDIRGNKYTWPLEYTSPNLTPEAVAPTPTAISKNITLPASNVSISSISETSATSAQAAFSELYENLVLKGITTNLDELLSLGLMSNVYIHLFQYNAYGVPTGSSGICITVYSPNDKNTASQWTFHYNGAQYYRNRQSSTINPWIRKTPVTNLTTAISGSPLDATIGKQLQDNKLDKADLKASNVPITAILGMTATNVQTAIAELYSMISK